MLSRESRVPFVPVAVAPDQTDSAPLLLICALMATPPDW
jgi:hypothetical protein